MLDAGASCYEPETVRSPIDKLQTDFEVFVHSIIEDDRVTFEKVRPQTGQELTEMLKAFTYVVDTDLALAKNDGWKSPSQTVKDGLVGDCEDAAMFVGASLKYIFPEHQVGILLLLERPLLKAILRGDPESTGEGHLVAVMVTSVGSEIVIDLTLPLEHRLLHYKSFRELYMENDYMFIFWVNDKGFGSTIEYDCFVQEKILEGGERK